MSAAAKDTIYIDAEDEITAVIDKVTSAKHKIVALVLPKRANVFQSPVNMKLLKKAAKSANKNLVLITSDKTILAIAGLSTVHVAKSLNSKPEIPKIDSSDSSEEPTTDGEAPELSDDEAIELDNTDESSPEPAKKESKKKLLKIPDFNSFRLKVGLAILGVVLLVVLWVFGFVIMPRATITINTNTSTTSISAPATLDVAQEELDLENNSIPAERVQSEKIDSVKVPATGEKNIGERATGLLTLTNCIDDGEQKVVPAGTRFSKDGLTFETTEQVILPIAIVSAGTCRSADFNLSEDVGAIAAEPGPQFNLSEGSYNSSISGIRAFGSDMSGGTTELVKVISEEDVRQAESQLTGSSSNEALSELESQLEESGLMPIEETLNSGEPETTVVPAVGQEADEVEVTITVTYSLMGISEEDLNQLLDNEARKKMGDQQKNIKDNGKDAVVFEVADRPNEAETTVTVQTVATLGPDIDEQQLKEDIAGKKRGDIENQIEAIDGVRSVSVEYSPVWITTTPKSADKIILVFNEPESDEQ